jgi:hypothetical protein
MISGAYVHKIEFTFILIFFLTMAHFVSHSIAHMDHHKRFFPHNKQHFISHEKYLERVRRIIHRPKDTTLSPYILFKLLFTA